MRPWCIGTPEDGARGGQDVLGERNRLQAVEVDVDETAGCLTQDDADVQACV
jgi:hypothetical protein